MESRLAQIDIYRVFAMLLVMAGHTEPFAGSNSIINTDPVFAVCINQYKNFAIPFFFLLSGYLFGMSSEKEAVATGGVFRRRISRLALIFGFWCGVYALVPTSISSLRDYGYVRTVYWKILSLIDSPMKLVFGGTEAHLWFPVSLILSLLVVSLLKKAGWDRILLPVSFTLFVMNMMAGTYAKTQIGFDTLFGIDNIKGPWFGPLFGTFFVAVGCRIAEKQWKFREGFGIGVLIGGLVFSIAENWVLVNAGAIKLDAFGNRDFSFGTIPIAVGSFLLLLSYTGHFKSRWVSTLGRLTLGVYGSHMLFVNLLRGIGISQSSAWEIFFPIIVFTLSALLALSLSRIPQLRKAVM
jgi:surface polysaccharide O-acyltransferase-like enzyme